MAHDLFSTPEHESFRRTVRQFVEQELRPRAREFDAMGRFDKSLYKRWASSTSSAFATTRATAAPGSTGPSPRCSSRS